MNTIRYEVSPPVSDDELNRLFETAWENYRPHPFDSILSRSLAYVCAYADQQLVGFVNVAWDGGGHAFILDTTVHADFQRCGIGSGLLAQAAAAASDAGIEWLHVDFEPHLTGFYRANGYQHTEAGLLRLG